MKKRSPPNDLWRMSILKRLATLLLGIRHIFEMACRFYLTELHNIVNLHSKTSDEITLKEMLYD